MKKIKLKSKIKTLVSMVLIVTMTLVNITKVKADSLQLFNYDGVSIYVNEKQEDSILELTISAEIENNIQLESITYKNDTFYFDNKVNKVRIVVKDEEPLQLNLKRELFLGSHAILRDEKYQFRTQLMEEFNHDWVSKKTQSKEEDKVLRVLDEIPNYDDIDSIIDDNEYININQENGQIEVLKLVDEIELTKCDSNQVKTGSNISSNINFYWGANESFAWQFPAGFSEISVNSLVAYCLEPTVMLTETNLATSTRIRDLSKIRIMDGRLYTTLSQKQIERIELIATYGFQYPGHSTKTYRWATQKMIFEAIGWVFESQGSPSVIDEVNEINRLISQHESKPSWNGKTLTYVPGNVIDLSDKFLEGYSLNLNNTKNIEITKFNGTKLEVKPLNDNAVIELIKISQSSVGDSLVFSDATSQKVGNLKLPIELKLNARFKAKPGNVKVSKTDTEGVEYSNVEFEISKNKLDILSTIKTNQYGIAMLNNMDPGVYYIREKSVPSPLVIDSKWYQIKIESDKTTEYNAVNARVMGEVHLLKTDDHGNPLGNVKFEIRDTNGKIIAKSTTNRDGKIVFKNIELGEYDIYETEVDYPYVLDPKPIRVHLEYLNSSTPIILKDIHLTNKEAKGKISIHKVSEEGYGIEGAIFEIKDHNMNSIGELITDKNGFATSEALKLGKYHVIETYVPKPYVLDTSKFEVNLEYVNQNTEIVMQTLTITNYPQLYEVEVLKKEDHSDPLFNEMHGQVIFDTEFSLYSLSADGEVFVGSGKTDINGKVLFKDLSLGKYVLKETKPSYGYKSNEEPIYLELLFNEEAANSPLIYKQMVVENSPYLGQANLIKVNEEGNLLEGAIFDLYTIENKFITRLTSNSEGLIQTPLLRYGKYYLQEIQAPIGHDLLEEKIYFTIKSSTDVLSLHAINKVHKANLNIRKIDSITRQPLSGARFKIKNLESGTYYSYIEVLENRPVVIDEWVSDINGMIYLNSPLSYGNYSLVEIEAPLGYNKTDDIKFSIDENQIYDIDDFGRTLNLEVENVQKQYSLEIHKFDSKNNKPIEGVTFALFSKDKTDIDDLRKELVSLYDENGNLIINEYSDRLEPVALGITNNNGIINFTNLNLDEYYLVELSAPFGFSIRRDIMTISKEKLLSQGDDTKLILDIKNNRSKFKIVANKRDSFSYDRLIGNDYILELYDSSGMKIKLDKYENGNHIWFVDALEIYYLKELKAPKGYKLSNESVKIDTSIDKGGIYEVDFFNDVMIEEVLPYTGKTNLNYLASSLISLGLLVVMLSLVNRQRN